MTGEGTMANTAEAGSRARLIAIVLAGGGALPILGANAHLVYVATWSEPACVPHLRQGDAAAPETQYSAAQSACSPPGIGMHVK